jgi:hypothetical protein
MGPGHAERRAATRANSNYIVFDRNTDKPYVVWSSGLVVGSRYDVRSYTVQVRYQALM